jgi:hypothetical protein
VAEVCARLAADGVVVEPLRLNIADAAHMARELGAQVAIGFGAASSPDLGVVLNDWNVSGEQLARSAAGQGDDVATKVRLIGVPRCGRDLAQRQAGHRPHRGYCVVEAYDAGGQLRGQPELGSEQAGSSVGASTLRGPRASRRGRARQTASGRASSTRARR